VLSKTTLHPSYTTRSLDSPPPAHHPYYHYLPMNDDELAVKIRARLEAELAWNAELRRFLGLEEINHDDSQEVVVAKEWCFLCVQLGQLVPNIRHIMVLERAEVLEGICDVKCDGKCDVEAIVAHMRLRLAKVKEEKERKQKEEAEDPSIAFCWRAVEDPIATDPTTIRPITHNGYSQAPKRQDLLSHSRQAARLPDGRAVCVSENANLGGGTTAEVFEPPHQGNMTIEASWRLRVLPDMTFARFGCGGCVLSDGRFAVFGGPLADDVLTATSSCKVLTLDGVERWEPLPAMHEARYLFACVAVEGCVIVAGGRNSISEVTQSVEVYEEALGRWRRLPCSLAIDVGRSSMSSALL
jgi:hypothetical protein